MPKVWYAVTATLPDQATADEYVHWLEDGHIDAVLRAGAHSGFIIRLDRRDGDGLPAAARQVVTQYVFSTRALYDEYIARHAPALRAQGLDRFGPARGITFERRTGEIL